MAQHEQNLPATLLYPVTAWPFRELYEMAAGWSDRRRAEVIDVALASRTRRDEILAGFRGGLYAYDMASTWAPIATCIVTAAARNSARHIPAIWGSNPPKLVAESGASELYESAMRQAFETLRRLPRPGADYLLPFGACSRFPFKMDFAEAEYISRLRSGVKAHFSYREIAWEMKCKMEQLEPELGRLIEATPPWIEDPLRR